MIGMVDLSKKGSKIHGIVEEYMAKGNISAGGFVKYLNEYKTGTDTRLNNTQSLQPISAVALSENKIFIAHSRSSDYSLYGMICTISGDAITLGTDTQLSANQRSGQYISAVKLTENKVFIANSYDNSYPLGGLVCIINDDTITAGTNVYISGGVNRIYSVSATTLDSNRVFISMGYGDYQKLYGIVCIIDETDINTITNTGTAQLNSINYSGQQISAVLLTQNKVLITHNDNNSNKYLNAMVCTINGDNTITIGTDTQLSSISNSGYKMSVVTLNKNKVFVAHRGDTSYLYGLICVITGTTITIGADTKLSDIQYSGNTIEAIALNEYNVLVVYGNTNYQLCSTAYTINGTKIIKKTDIQLSTTNNTGENISATILSKGNIFVAHSYSTNYLLYGILVNHFSIVQSATQADKIYRHSHNKSKRWTTRQGRKTKLYYRGGKLNEIYYNR